MTTHPEYRPAALKINIKRKRPRQHAKIHIQSPAPVGLGLSYGDAVENLKASLLRTYCSAQEELPLLAKLSVRGYRAAVDNLAQANAAKVAQQARSLDAASFEILDQVRELIAQELDRPDEPRTARFEARLTTKERAVIQRAADISGRSLSDFVVHAAHQAALQEIEHQVILRLSQRDSETLAAALDTEPSEPTAAFNRAVAMRDKISRRQD